jgi:hypothetical protein
MLDSMATKKNRVVSGQNAHNTKEHEEALKRQEKRLAGQNDHNIQEHEKKVARSKER